jgi:TolB-like protein/lipoprotein NlpI
LRQGARARILTRGLSERRVVTESGDAEGTRAAPDEQVAASVPVRSMSVWARIKEHKVAQWTLAYAAAAYAVLHGTELVSNALDWPHLLVRIVALLLILGLPLVVTIAWFNGHRSQRRASAAELTIIAVLLVIAGVALAYFARPPQEHAVANVGATAHTTAPQAQPATATPAERSIAVLPFTDMSEGKDQEYFADGMAEEIISLLAQVRELHVSARTSSFFFKGKATKVSDIARELGVAHLLEGSVRKSGDQLRLTAQLIRADNGYHVWSKTYDRDVRDMFRVQDEVANAVVQALRISLAGELARPEGGTENIEAYELYLRAVSADSQNTKLSLEAAHGDLDRAIELDPNFALAWVELAGNAMQKTLRGLLTQKEGSRRARQLAQHAVELSPNLVEAHALLAGIYRTYDWDWQAAEAEMRRALSLEPTHSWALQSAGMISATFGRWDQAERYYRLALVNDPLNVFVLGQLGNTLYYAGRFTDAEAAYRKLLEVAPGFAYGPYYRGRVLLAQGKRDAALAAVQQEKEEEARLQLLPIMLHATGHQAEADKALKVLIAKFAETSAYSVAMAYAYRNEHDLAFRWLDRAYEQKDADLAAIRGEHLFKNIASDPRYEAFLRKMNLAG